MTQNKRHNPSHIFRTGGSLSEDAPSYVQRYADTELYDALLQGEFCYILTSRQMGKSSLMVRTAARLRQNSVRVAALDVTAVGSNLSAEQWYFGLLDILAEQLGVEDEMEAFWEQHANLGPMRRFMAAVQTIALPAASDSLVIFVDEIDAVRQLPFKADEFFAAIRECYNQRTQNKDLERFTFCLIGVASPSDLIEDTRMTPFNIGKRIDLTDFTQKEVVFFASGLNKAQAQAQILRVLYWTGGHPYLTQRLCCAIAESADIQRVSDVDALVDTLFFSSRAREQDDNLAFVRNRLLRSEGDLAALLEMYRQIWRGRRVADDAINPLCGVVKLSGVCKAKGSILQVRNRIYHHVFDRAWITVNMPAAELRRQRAAYRKGLIRAMALSSPIIMVVVVLAVWAFQKTLQASISERKANQLTQQKDKALQDALTQKKIAEARKQEAVEQRKIADKSAADARRNARIAQQMGERAKQNANLRIIEAERANNSEKAVLQGKVRAQVLSKKLAVAKALAKVGEYLSYPIFMQSAQSALSQGNVSKARIYLEGFLPSSPSTEDLRGFEWRYLRYECRDISKDTLNGHHDGVATVAFSPNGSQIASMETGGDVHLWDVSTRKQTIISNLNPQRSLVFLRNGHTLVVGTATGAIFWDVQTGKEQQPPFPALNKVTALALSPDEKWLACGLANSRIDIWDIAAHRLIKSLYGGPEGSDEKALIPINDLAFSPDGKTLGRGCSTIVGHNNIKLWNMTTFTEKTTFTYVPEGNNDWGHTNCLAFSPEGKYVVTGGDQVARMWNVATQQPIEIARHSGSITRVVFSPDKRWLATGSGDSTIQLFDAADVDAGRIPIKVATLRGHTNAIEAIAFSPDSRALVSGSADKTLKLWDIETVMQPMIKAHEGQRVGPLCYSPDGKLLATGSYHDSDPTGGNRVYVWDVQTRKRITKTPSRRHDWSDSIYMAFAPDGKTLAVANADGTLHLCDVHTGNEVAAFEGTHGSFNILAFSPDGKWIATGDTKYVYEAHNQGFMVRLWNVATHKEVKEFANRQTVGHKGWVLALAFSPDSKTLVSGGGEGELRWWDVDRQKEIDLPSRGVDGRALPSKFVHRKDISSVAFSPNGRWLATGSEDGSAGLWEAKTRKLVQFMLGNQGLVTSVAFASDGKTLATAGKDGTVKLWSLATLKQKVLLDTVTLSGGHGGIRTLTFSPDGHTLATGHFDGTVLFWRTESTRL